MSHFVMLQLDSHFVYINMEIGYVTYVYFFKSYIDCIILLQEVLCSFHKMFSFTSSVF